MLDSAADLGNRASSFLKNHPKAESAFAGGHRFAAKGVRAAGTGVRKAGQAVPDPLSDWSEAAFHSLRNQLGRIARAGLSPKRVVGQYKKHGHVVTRLSDIRGLDLEAIDLVRGRASSWYYPAIAALSGASAGLVITGGELAVPASAGAAAGPSGATIVAAFAGDAAFVVGLSSRSVGHIALQYGYDPEEPAEKIFLFSVINAGTAASQAAKTAAFSDISRLTQALVRGKAWVVLDKSIVSKVVKQTAELIGKRLTKNSLGKALPAVGIAVGSAFNWATLEGVVDAADIAYRRRFLLEKYPHLQVDSHFDLVMDGTDSFDGEPDDVISVVDELRNAGGPAL